ncbi:Tudor domain-containing protein 6 [Folsomia candida]|uniref:Tudor domain-containing protein 6 n=1 Tax=Folsomia candida TaxID=158441 RepID=A0A226EFF5_FOLCA|nr:Tudor domain-containing protein 6 [Folsomia candida]
MMINPFKVTKCVDLEKKPEAIETIEEVKNIKQSMTAPESKHSDCEIAPEPQLVQKPQKTEPSSAPALEKEKGFMWQSCKYSKNLIDSAMVKVCYVWNVNLIQIVAEEDEADLNNYMDKIYSVKTEPLTGPPIVGGLYQMVLGNYADGQFYRRRVLKVMGELFTVYFVDYGDSRDIPYTDMLNDPIYSARVILDATPTLISHIKPDKDL